VSLRLEAGSQEEGFLAQLYPIPKKPTVVVIKNGQLREYIAAGVSKEDFIRRMKTVFEPVQPAPVPPATEAAQPTPEHPAVTTTQAASAPETSQPAPATAPTPDVQAPPASEPAASPNPPNASADPSSPPATATATASTSLSSTNAQVQAILAERAARLAEQKKQQDEEAKRKRVEKAKARAEAEAAQATAQSRHAAELRKRQQEARAERERILKAIEDDKAARRAKREQEEAARRAAAAAAASEKGESTINEEKSAPFAPASQVFPPLNTSSRCAIQVRLFDGSTIRERFSADETLADVRKWVDETRRDVDGPDKNAPYTFKVLLTPLPNRTIDVTEESKSLRELGLAPSATLILLRVPKRVIAAAARGEGQGLFWKIIRLLMSVFTGFFGTLSAFFSTLFSTRGLPAPPPGESDAGTAGGVGQTTQSQTGGEDAGARRRGTGGRIAGLGDLDERRRREEQQYYNGNSVSLKIPRLKIGYSVQIES
jgi:chemotaxis protein histidine kinase CheA